MSETLRLLLLLAGVGLVIYGAWLAWPPAGLVLAGCALMRVATYRVSAMSAAAAAARGAGAASGRVSDAPAGR